MRIDCRIRIYGGWSLRDHLRIGWVGRSLRKAAESEGPFETLKKHLKGCRTYAKSEGPFETRIDGGAESEGPFQTRLEGPFATRLSHIWWGAESKGSFETRLSYIWRGRV